MREIVSPLDGFLSPFGVSGSGGVLPASALIWGATNSLTWGTSNHLTWG